ncbi:MAG: DUF4214 domain-containing protein [Huintestinicola sp.]
MKFRQILAGISAAVMLQAALPGVFAEELLGDAVAEEGIIEGSVEAFFDSVPADETDYQSWDAITKNSQTFSLKAGEYTAPYSYTGCSYSSNNPSVATVTKEGVIVGWSEGQAVITVKNSAGTVLAEDKVNVSAGDTAASASYALSGAKTMNKSHNDYSSAYAAATVNSYIYENNGITTRVEYTGNNAVLVERYSDENKLIDICTVAMELPEFGGFFCGKQYNFLVFGQNNTSASDSVEVLRVVKYDKNWNRISAYSQCGANTTKPFAAGSLRMDEAGNRLYVYTCHQMYPSSDGLCHQSNMTFVLNQTTMTCEQSYYKVMNVSAGYVSHSFNQFVKTDGNYVFRVDHGDYYPRAIYMSRCMVGGAIDRVSYGNIFDIKDATTYHYNYTGVSIGGFELSSTNTLLVGNSIDQNDSSTTPDSQRNIFLIVIPKNLSSIDTLWLTEYASTANITVRTPQLVKLTDEHFMVMWEEVNKSTNVSKVQSVLIDSWGNVSSRRELKNYTLSDCQPVMTSKGTLMWYVSDGQSVTKYEYAPFAPDPIEAFVERLYTKLLGRASDVNGKANHVQRLRNGASAADIAKLFVTSTELQNKKLTNREFVRRMYVTMLDRNPDAGGLTRWATALDNGCSYGYVLAGFSTSAEFTKLCQSYGITRGTYVSAENRDKNEKLTAYVSRMYTKALNRKYDIKGLNNHTGRYIAGTRDAKGIAHDFIFSAEFLRCDLSDDAFINTMYATFFDRDPDATGKANWTARMNSGWTREQVFDGFTSSAEFKTLVAGFGI